VRVHEAKWTISRIARSHRSTVSMFIFPPGLSLPEPLSHPLLLGASSFTKHAAVLTANLRDGFINVGKDAPGEPRAARLSSNEGVPPLVPSCFCRSQPIRMLDFLSTRGCRPSRDSVRLFSSFRISFGRFVDESRPVRQLDDRIR